MPIRGRRWVEICAVLVVILVAIGIRLQDLQIWLQVPALLFHQGEPMLSTLDAPYYLGLARDLAEGTYEPVDTMRAVPDFPQRPPLPPLLSVITAAVHAVTPFSWAWIGAILPMVLGSLVAIPMYLLARRYRGPAAGITAALAASLAPVYVSRSGLGWLDTDVMNVTWILLIVWCFCEFAFRETRDRYRWAAGGFASAALLLWWWDQAPQVVVAFTGATLAAAIVFFYRPNRREGWVFFGACAVLLTATLFWLGFDLPARIARAAVNSLTYIAKTGSDGPFPGIGVSVSEQERPPLAEIATLTMAHGALFATGMVGLLVLIVREPRRSLMLIVPALLGALTFLAMRFAIFLAPLLALGAGVLVEELWRLRKRTTVAYLLVPAAIAATGWPLAAADWRATIRPRELAPYVAGMTPLATETPRDAVIWAWWDHGYNLNFWARRATVNDGSVHDGERSVYNALPMAADSFRLAANFMRFYVVRGKSGLHSLYAALGNDPHAGLALARQVLSEGPENARAILAQASLTAAPGDDSPADWLEFFYPREAPPVYLFIDQYTAAAAYWWYWYGSWNVKAQSGTHPRYIPVFGARRLSAERVSGAHDITVDLATGEVRFARRSYRPSQFIGAVSALGRERIKLDVAYIYTTRGIESRRYGHPEGYRLDFSPDARFATVTTPDIGASVFNLLFAGRTYDARYFKPVLADPGVVQVWQVLGEVPGEDPRGTGD